MVRPDSSTNGSFGVFLAASYTAGLKIQTLEISITRPSSELPRSAGASSLLRLLPGAGGRYPEWASRKQ